jgi:two-component system, OmpR family, sensor histidine kinase CiaH
MFRRARWILALWYAGALAVTIVAIGAAAYLTVRKSMDDDITGSLQKSATNLVTTTDIARTGGQVPPPDGDRGSPRVLRGGDEALATALESDVFYLTTDTQGNLIANPRQVNLTGLNLAELAGEANAATHTEDVSAAGHHYRILTEPLNATIGPAYLYVGRSLDARDQQLRTLAIVLGLGGVVGVAVSGAGGWWLAGRALVPIRKSLDTQRRFISDASHELRTPIAVVKANNELLLRHPEDTIESAYDQVEAVGAEADHMAHLVDDLLTLARADEGRTTLTTSDFDLGELAQEVGRDMGALAELRGLTLDLDTSKVEVEADAPRLRQLVVILLDNALKYTPKGGRVTLRVVRSGRRAELSVRDTGPGISPDDQKRVFDRFFRIDEARARAVGGSGLGLAIGKWIAEAHEGRLTVESAPGQGATFTLRLHAKD